MDWQDQVALAYISSHDFLFYCSREYNTRGLVEKFMGNYALIYAVNTDISAIHRAAAGISPHYQEDFQKISTYLTPAYPVTNKAVLQDSMVSWDALNTVDFTYNAVGEAVTFGMTPAELNFPNLGCYEKFCPLTTFATFVIGPRRPAIIRWGKKLVPCRMYYVPVNDVKIRTGKIRPTHPVNTAEFPPEAQLQGGTILFVKPANLVIEPEIEGRYIQGKVCEKTIRIALPHQELYPGVFAN